MSQRPTRILLAALCSFAIANAHAADDDTITTDRPGVAESSQVVGKGRVQLETSVQWERLRSDDEHSRTLSTPTLLRIGLGESSELRIETDGRSIIHDNTPGAAPVTTAGWADTEVGFKWHLADAQGTRPSLGVLLHAALPSGSEALRGHGLRPSLRLSAEWELADGYALGLMPGVGSDSDDNGQRYGYGVLAANLGKDFGEHAHGFVELAAPQVARAAHGGIQLLADAGVTYALNKDCQVDVAVTHGLNRRTPDLGLAFGLSVRR